MDGCPLSLVWKVPLNDVTFVLTHGYMCPAEISTNSYKFNSIIIQSYLKFNIYIYKINKI